MIEYPQKNSVKNILDIKKLSSVFLLVFCPELNYFMQCSFWLTIKTKDTHLHTLYFALFLSLFVYLYIL